MYLNDPQIYCPPESGVMKAYQNIKDSGRRLVRFQKNGDSIRWKTIWQSPYGQKESKWYTLVEEIENMPDHGLYPVSITEDDLDELKEISEQ